MQRKLLGIINVDFDATGQLLVIYSAFVKYLRKKWKCGEAVHQVFIDFKKAYNSIKSGGGGALFNNLFELDTPRSW